MSFGLKWGVRCHTPSLSIFVNLVFSRVTPLEAGGYVVVTVDMALLIYMCHAPKSPRFIYRAASTAAVSYRLFLMLLPCLSIVS